MRLLALLTLALVSIPHARASTEYTLVKADAKKKIVYVYPVWSPADNSIAYIAIRNCAKLEMDSVWSLPKDLWLATQSHGQWKHRLLVRDAERSAWSKDGKRLAMSRNGLAVLELGSGKLRQLTTDCIPNGGDGAGLQRDLPISFSPSGRYLAYQRDVDRDVQYRVFDLEKGQDAGLSLGQHAVWSADSRYVLSSFNWYGSWPVQTRLIRTDMQSGKSETLLPHHRIEWLAWPSPDYALALVADRDPRTYPEIIKYPEDELDAPKGRGIYRLDTTSRKLTKVSDIEDTIIVNRDFSRFAAISDATLYVGKTSDWQYRILAQGVAEPFRLEMAFASWSPDGESVAYATTRGDIRIAKFH